MSSEDAKQRTNDNATSKNKFFNCAHWCELPFWEMLICKSYFRFGPNVSCMYSQYIDQTVKIPSWLAWEEIEFTVVHVASPKMTHKPVSTSLVKQAEQALRAYCPIVPIYCACNVRILH